MPARRSHQKSRRGCLQCKQAHVKCKEDGPPCERCKLRGTTCGFASPSASSGTQQEVSPAKYGVVVAPSVPAVEAQLEATPLFPANARLLDLQLMHRWSTMTFKSMCTPAADDEYVWRIKAPMWALQYDFLLNGLLALTAFEAASCCPAGTTHRELYVHAATGYQAQALGEFQKYLLGHGNNPDTGTYDQILTFSLTLMVLALASAQFISDDPASTHPSPNHNNMVQNTILHYELVRGCGTVLGAGAEEYIASNPHIQKLTRFEDLPRLPVDSPRAIAIAKLTELNERRLTSTIAEPYEARVQHVKYFEACKTAIALLQECFAKCGGEDDVDEKTGYQGYILAWLNLAGEEYVQAIKDGDQVAVLILMLWGPAVEKLGSFVWWARGFGRMLVEEIAREVGRWKDDGGVSGGEIEDGLTKNLIVSAMEMMVEPRAPGS